MSLRPGQARLLLITPVAGVIMLSALFVVQVRSTGTTAYYFVKLLLGYELILAVVVPALVAGLAVALLPPRKRKLPGILGSVAMSLGALAAFGVITPSQASLFNEDASGTASIAPPYSRAGMADGILAAARANDPSTGFQTVYVALGSASAAELFYPDSWFHALDGSVTERVMTRMTSMHRTVSTPDEAAGVIGALLEEEPHLVIYVSQELAAEVQERLPTASAARVEPIPATTAPLK